MRQLRGFAVIILLWATWLPAATGQWPQEPPLAQIDAETATLLGEGQVVVDNTRLDESGGAARVHALFQGSAESVWALLESCAANYQFVEGLVDCEVLELTATHALTRHVVKRHLFAPRMEYIFETARQPYQWIVIRLVSGDLDAMEGSWRFDAMEGGSSLLVTHHIRVRPKFPVPRWLVRRTLYKDLGDMVACMRAMVGASGTEERRQQDRNRCP